ncbi:neuropeptides B/W receptor type 1 [Pitangus sulphuratus]|nr:neuropeptides B/W receptor type 1 [Pitangus sulphuratus]
MPPTAETFLPVAAQRYLETRCDFSPRFYITVPFIYCAMGLTGNTAVIYVILKVPKMKTVTNIFILNLAIADELFILVLPINITDYLLLQWPFGEFMCKLIISIDQYNTFSSIYFLTAMSIDRYLVMVATSRLRHMQLNCDVKALDKAKKKVALMEVVILVVCLFCWTPYHLSTVVALITVMPQTPVIIGISYFITSLSYANSCFNPFLYAFLDDSFQRSFCKLIDRMKGS